MFVPALLAGNAVLYKPSEFATLTGLAHRRDAARGRRAATTCSSPVIGDGATGAALLRQPVDGVFFTGSYATGAKIAAAAGRRMIKVQLELGGKDPIYVCDDVDVKAAAAGVADGAFYNTGQSCCSVERIYVHESIHDAFVDAFVAEVKGFKIGDPMDEATYIGADHAQAAARRAARSRWPTRRRRARSSLTGGNVVKRQGQLVRSRRCFADVDHSMALMRDESFGPIIGIQAVADDDAAVDLMNDTEYGLTAGVYTRDAKRARKILAQRARRHRLLELLRSREPAAAVVGRRALGHRPHAVDLRHPDVHAAEGVAPALAVDPPPSDGASVEAASESRSRGSLFLEAKAV